MKKLLPFLIFSLTFFQLPAQSWQELYDSTNDCWRTDWETCKDLLEKALVAAREEFGEMDSNYATTLNDLGVSYKNTGNYQKAEIYLLEAKDIIEKVSGKEHPDYANTLNNLGTLYRDMGNYQKAEIYLLESKDIREKVSGKEHPEYANTLSKLGTLYREMGNDQKAEKYYLESKDIREKVSGKEHPEYANTLSNLGTLYRDMGNYQKAEIYYLETKKIDEKLLGKEHPDYANTLNKLGILYTDMGNYQKAEIYFLESKDIREKVLGKEHPEYASTLNKLGILYTDMGNYQKAEIYLLESKDIREKVLGKEHPEYASTLNNLGILYTKMGNYQKVEIYFLETKKLDEKLLGKEHPEYASKLNNLGTLYTEMGNYQKAEKYLLESKDIREKVSGKEHPHYATALNNLGALYEQMGNYQKAEIYYLETKKLDEKLLGKEHQYYGNTLMNLGVLYKDMREFEKSNVLLTESLHVFEKSVGQAHRLYGRSLSHLATVAIKENDILMADSLLLQAQEITNKALGKNHIWYSQVLNSLAFLHILKEDYTQSKKFYTELDTLQRDLLLKVTRFTSEQELKKYTHQFEHQINQLYTFNQLYTDPEMNGLSFNQALFYQGFLLNTSNQIRRLANTDSASAEQFSLLKSYHRRLATQYAQPPSKRTGVKELEAQINTLEKEMTQTVAGFGEAIRQVNWQEVQAQLQANESAIEFINYTNTLSKNQDSTMYAALVLKPGDEAPQFIPLFEEKELGDFVNAQGGSRAAYANQLYASRGMRGIKPRKSQRKGSKSLLELNWAPLEEHLEGIKTIYYVPSGILHRMNLDAIPISKKETLGDKYELIRLGSTRQLVVNRQNQDQTGEALLFGGIQYEMDSTAITRANAGEAQEVLSSDQQIDFNYYSDRNLRGGSWQYLNWTEKEATDIASILQQANIPTNLKTGFTATEEAFQQSGKGKTSPRILHLATHGFFFPDPVDTLAKKQLAMGSSQSTFRMSDHPMIRSGLILAGANHAWQTNEPIEGLEDGILTAYEISQMNLSNTELVVLSACETGLGDIEGNEGVYGLQRAFKIAGVRNLIMSLWQVPDKETMEFMTTFYQNWLEEEMEIPEAFRATQKAMRKKYEEPYKWAGFVLVE